MSAAEYFSYAEPNKDSLRYFTQSSFMFPELTVLRHKQLIGSIYSSW